MSAGAARVEGHAALFPDARADGRVLTRTM
jgi:hypothetical protein